MDKKDRNYISSGFGNNKSQNSYSRKVSRNDYDINLAHKELQEKREQHKRDMEKRKQHKKKRMRVIRIRALYALAAAAVIAVFVLFFTPLLDIEGFNVDGNSIVTRDEILTRLDKYNGTNLIMLSEREVKNALSDLSYIEDVSVSKFLIPPSALVTIKECKPVASIEVNGYTLIIDPQLKILTDGGKFEADDLAVIEGINISKYAVGKTLEQSDEYGEKLEILSSCLELMDLLGMTDKLDYIDLSDITDIRFGYDNRLDALCGTRLELERKIRMFNATVSGNNLADNAHGTIDLSKTGEAVYIP